MQRKSYYDYDLVSYTAGTQGFAKPNLQGMLTFVREKGKERKKERGAFIEVAARAQVFKFLVMFTELLSFSPSPNSPSRVSEIFSWATSPEVERKVAKKPKEDSKAPDRSRSGRSCSCCRTGGSQVFRPSGSSNFTYSPRTSQCSSGTDLAYFKVSSFGDALRHWANVDEKLDFPDKRTDLEQDEWVEDMLKDLEHFAPQSHLTALWLGTKHRNT